MIFTTKKCNEKINNQSSLEKQNSNNNNNNNNKNNTYSSKNNNNKIITIALPKTDTKINFVKFKKEKELVPKVVLLRENFDIDKHSLKIQIHLLRFKDGKARKQLDVGNSAYVTCF